MFYISIPQCCLINEELDGYLMIYIDYKPIYIMIKAYTFQYSGYLFYKINRPFNINIKYNIYNYSQINVISTINNSSQWLRDQNNEFNIFTNILKNIKQTNYSNGIVNILHNSDYIIIKASETTYTCKRLYFNTNKEFIIDSIEKTLPAFKLELPTIEVSAFELPKLELPGLELPRLELPGLELPRLELPELELPQYLDI